MFLQNMQSDNPQLSRLASDVYDLRLTITHTSKELPTLIEVGELVDVVLLNLWDRHHGIVE